MADAVIFDVDGTLVDTNYLHAVCWWEAFRQHGHGVDMADVHGAIGMGSDKLLDHLLPDDRDRDADDDMRAAHRSLYATFWPRLRAFDGAADLLRACAGRGMKVVLASSAAASELAALRAALDADDAISAATSSSEADESKPAPDIVSIALERAGVEPTRAVFVGDTIWDVHACRKAGVVCVAVRTGGICTEDLREAGAVEVYESTADLLRNLDHSPLAAS
ncbi:HAD family hydrolase [Actinoallomurus iriomotensis]|uniref:Haloacid dehalogenase n=1 Tax=Actinoallomurus iriomotensis TaxID=478107 RepID=A0A9W6RU79_9ACTN|nr:HAD family hydrolase [Actinoallomurus iriomotensis]GLY80207.1 haloacid dehalogenase [Actinoallomurus iriomotensis]GLY87628.1 haloacid dehalogenase [Actinoallomurus iriomotensis]